VGAGGYGEVFKAHWKGTKVAVKTILANSSSRELKQKFKEEARIPPLFDPTLTQQAGEGDEGTESSQCGPVHGSLHQASQVVHCYGVHVSRLSMTYSHQFHFPFIRPANEFLMLILQLLHNEHSRHPILTL